MRQELAGVQQHPFIEFGGFALAGQQGIQLAGQALQDGRGGRRRAGCSSGFCFEGGHPRRIGQLAGVRPHEGLERRQHVGRQLADGLAAQGLQAVASQVAGDAIIERRCPVRTMRALHELSPACADLR